MPKRNIYLKEQDVETWDNLPSGERSKLLQNVLDNYREYNLMREGGDENELYKKMYLYENQLQEARLIFNKYWEYESKFGECEERVMATGDEIEEKFKVKLITMAYYSDNVHDRQEFVDLIIRKANEYVKSKKVITDDDDKEEYVIEGVEDDVIYLNKLSLKSDKLIVINPKSLIKAVDNLNKKGGTLIRINQFSASPLHRLIIVELHPKLQYVSQWIALQPRNGE